MEAKENAQVAGPHPALSLAPPQLPDPPDPTPRVLLAFTQEEAEGIFRIAVGEGLSVPQVIRRLTLVGMATVRHQAAWTTIAPASRELQRWASALDRVRP